MNPQNQEPKFPHQNDDYAQQQAEVQRQMQQIMNTELPIQQSQQKPTLGILALIFAVVFPPLGLILAISAIFKGFIIAKHKALGLMGVVALLVSTLMLLVFITLLFSSDANNTDIEEQQSNAQRSQISLHDTLIQLDVPEGFEETEVTEDYMVWEAGEDELADKITVSVGDNETLDLAQQAAGSNLTDAEDTIWANTLLTNDLSDCDNPKPSEIKNTQLNGQNAAHLSYTCNIVGEDNRVVSFQGEYISMITKDNKEVTIHYFVKAATWEASSDVFNRSVENIRINKK